MSSLMQIEVGHNDPREGVAFPPSVSWCQKRRMMQILVCSPAVPTPRDARPTSTHAARCCMYVDNAAVFDPDRCPNAMRYTLRRSEKSAVYGPVVGRSQWQAAAESGFGREDVCVVVV